MADPPLTAYCAFPSLPSPTAFRRPLRTIAAYSPDAVAPCLAQAELLASQGLALVGTVAYEAAAAFEPRVRTVGGRDGDEPLVLFRAYEPSECFPGPLPPAGVFLTGEWMPSVTREKYDACIAAVREAIRDGNTYQTNYTMRLRTDFSGDHLGLFSRLVEMQACRYACFLDAGRRKVLSASPERFFTWDRAAGTIETRPMKGTAARGLDSAGDAEARERLRASPKERAENLMIVDLLRNDLSRIAERGSVHVPSLFAAEMFPTVWQMTSTVAARVREGVRLADVMAALFPCGSVTGAPKLRTMDIIADLECSPRGVYCGALVYISPGGGIVDASVPIRTCVVDALTGTAEYGVGGGITWDSTAGSEWEECWAKARVLLRACDPSVEVGPRAEFDLFETMRMEPDGAVLLLDLHLQRLRASAEYFAFRTEDLDRDVEQALAAIRDDPSRGRTGKRIRFTLSRDGTVGTTVAALPAPFSGAQRVVPATSPIDPSGVRLYHKTTDRRTYDAAKSSADALRAACGQSPPFDALLWNPAGEATEFSIGCLVAELPSPDAPRLPPLATGTHKDLSPVHPSAFPSPREGHALFTPPVRCGLLPGVMRARALELGIVEERPIAVRELEGRRAWLLNAVRGWVEVAVEVEGKAGALEGD
ncbi:ADC synthase [Hyaloraphidium curvatum]|nr:ADC synthase [Hyaloraphidium curvatum]